MRNKSRPNKFEYLASAPVPPNSMLAGLLVRASAQVWLFDRPPSKLPPLRDLLLRKCLHLRDFILRNCPLRSRLLPSREPGTEHATPFLISPWNLKTRCHGFYPPSICICMALACRVVGPKAQATQQRLLPSRLSHSRLPPKSRGRWLDSKTHTTTKPSKPPILKALHNKA